MELLNPAEKETANISRTDPLRHHRDMASRTRCSGKRAPCSTYFTAQGPFWGAGGAVDLPSLWTEIELKFHDIYKKSKTRDRLSLAFFWESSQFSSSVHIRQPSWAHGNTSHTRSVHWSTLPLESRQPTPELSYLLGTQILSGSSGSFAPRRHNHTSGAPPPAGGDLSWSKGGWRVLCITRTISFIHTLQTTWQFKRGLLSFRVWQGAYLVLFKFNSSKSPYQTDTNLEKSGFLQPCIPEFLE